MVQYIKEKRREVGDNAVVSAIVVPRAAYKDLINSLASSSKTSSSFGLLPKPRNVAKQIQRKRKIQLGILDGLPQNWTEYTVPDIYRITVTNQPFQIMDTETEDGKKIWGFMSPPVLTLPRIPPTYL